MIREAFPLSSFSLSPLGWPDFTGERNKARWTCAVGVDGSTVPCMRLYAMQLQLPFMGHGRVEWLVKSDPPSLETPRRMGLDFLQCDAQRRSDIAIEHAARL